MAAVPLITAVGSCPATLKLSSKKMTVKASKDKRDFIFQQVLVNNSIAEKICLSRDLDYYSNRLLSLLFSVIENSRKEELTKQPHQRQWHYTANMTHEMDCPIKAKSQYPKSYHKIKLWGTNYEMFFSQPYKSSVLYNSKANIKISYIALFY
jgi:hypothetical protein